MKANSQESGGVFHTLLSAVAMIAPMGLVVVAGAWPQGSRGALVVNGLEVLVALLALMVTMRVVYALGFASAAAEGASPTPPARRIRRAPRATTPRASAMGSTAAAIET